MKRRKAPLIVGILILLTIGIAFSLFWYQRACDEEMRAEIEEREQIEELYERVNLAFFSGPVSRPLPIDMEYRPFPMERIYNHPFSINFSLYSMMLFYWSETGQVLTFEMILEYFSQEHEVDGTLRLYNNGKHPEIQAFVDWIWDGDGGVDRWNKWIIYRDRLSIALRVYSEANAGSFVQPEISELSPQMLWALARAKANPNYVLDLTSLQQAGY